MDKNNLDSDLDSNIVRNTNEETDDVAAYENARKDQGNDKNPVPASDKEVESANVRLNPDENTLDRG